MQPATEPTDEPAQPTGYAEFDRAAWARLRASTPLTLTEEDLAALRGVNEAISLDEVADVYLPVSRLLNLSVGATRELHRATATFLGESVDAPFVIGLAGSVAVGKSTIARILQRLLSRWPESPRVDLVTTDGFLLSERRPRVAESPAPQGFPGELRPPRARPVRGRREGRVSGGARARLLARGVRHRARPRSRWCGRRTC